MWEYVGVCGSMWGSMWASGQDTRQLQEWTHFLGFGTPLKRDSAVLVKGCQGAAGAREQLRLHFYKALGSGGGFRYIYIYIYRLLLCEHVKAFESRLLNQVTSLCQGPPGIWGGGRTQRGKELLLLTVLYM